MAEVRSIYACGKFGKMIPVRLRPGTDLINGLKKVCEDNGVRYGVLMTAIGSLQKLTFKTFVPDKKAKLGAAYTEAEVLPGPIEILGANGVIVETQSGEIGFHLHGSFADKHGKVYGGHLVDGGNPILATLDAVIGEITDAKFMRRYDEEADLNLSTPEPL